MIDMSEILYALSFSRTKSYTGNTMAATGPARKMVNQNPPRIRVPMSNLLSLKTMRQPKMLLLKPLPKMNLNPNQSPSPRRAMMRPPPSRPRWRR